MQNIEFHPLAGIFPLMSDREFESLCADISENGQHEPIWIYDNKIIDGRNRYNACRAVNIEPSFTNYTGAESEIIKFVLSLNLHRRHLNESQRAMVAANVANMRQGERTDIAQICAMSQTQAAELLNVSRRNVQNAAQVQQKATPELIEQVTLGNIAVSTAAIVSELPKEEQSEIVARGEKEILEAAKKIKAEKAADRINLPLTAANSAPNPEGDDWYTPPNYIEAARSVLGEINLDPASSDTAQKVVKAEKYFTKETDGLNQKWFGNVWLNPPYSYPLIENFTNKLLSEYDEGNINQAIIVVNNCTDTGWFHSLVNRFPVCLPRRRVSFWRPGENFAARQGQAFFYLGNSFERFCSVFSEHGVVLKKIDEY